MYELKCCYEYKIRRAGDHGSVCVGYMLKNEAASVFKMFHFIVFHSGTHHN
ncbi:hypothetical protein HJ01_03335 [Flavobacterium frigoris PS1]|uniref:Uncharacterized protein n=1 Tax=Flavobacterium frigoris (strain PS1) TaxID=1086011 RepID=H7FW09_FLAFP|nr:hypothetical protein HJ01_03335 [Flavobacterium frigoris PS1]